MGCGFTVCRCIIPSTYINGIPMPRTSSTEVIPSPLADYFIDMLKASNPIFPITFNRNEERIDHKVRDIADMLWREHIEETLKCPKGHKADIDGGWGDEIYVYCTEKDCFFATNDLNF